MALNATFVKQQAHKGSSNGEKYADGGGMYLHVTATGKYWRLSYRFAGKQKTLALGTYPDVSLIKARDRRAAARTLLADGIDPGVAKREEKQNKAEAAANTFEAVARDWLAKSANRRAAVTQAKVTNWLEKDVFPFIGTMPITTIKAKDVLDRVARRMEARGIHESAHRIVQICSQVFRFAVATGVVDRDVTADLRGALVAIKKTNYAAITEPKPVGQLMRLIHAYSGHPTVVAALKLSPLVFLRPGELRAAEWSEIDLDAGQWRLPASKMKMKIEHVVPLSRQAVAILREVQPVSGHGRYVFPSIRTGERCMSENTISAALRGMGYSKDAMTAHGFRAMARTIMDEVLGERPDLIEHQLAHTVKDPNGRAYNRTAHLPARKEMMQRWADYLDKLRVGAEVIEFRKSHR
ncbi:integrase arm-type DNA-binding domain-containing protein [Variovorax sp. J22R115]|uniref:tyrosine-type recombinase/integrase n=1 Tax=Variovorax sp. J22R115 TaxID=3053509 RepID=UPI002578CFD4|nr:integrase arm-type DNA-binding domain-containing protein [Variovorax sp. J22R115]MDM0051417.1 integrase arm-type DNA-binding domain-containing protein [Variovorax sp. J22R115]